MQFITVAVVHVLWCDEHILCIYILTVFLPVYSMACSVFASSDSFTVLYSAVIRFQPLFPDRAVTPGPIDVVLEPRTLYVMHGVMRWEYTHEVLNSEASAEVWAGSDGVDRDRGRRLSVIVRDLGGAGVFGCQW